MNVESERIIPTAMKVWLQDLYVLMKRWVMKFVESRLYKEGTRDDWKGLMIRFFPLSSLSSIVDGGFGMMKGK